MPWFFWAAKQAGILHHQRGAPTGMSSNVARKAQNAGNLLIVERANVCRCKIQVLGLQEKVFGSMAHFDMHVAAGAAAVLGGRACMHRTKNNNGRSRSDPHLFHCGRSEFVALVTRNDRYQAVSMRLVMVDTGREPLDMPRNHIKLEWIERPGRWRGAQLAVCGNALCGPEQLPDVRKGERRGSEVTHRTALLQQLRQTVRAIECGRRQSEHVLRLGHSRWCCAGSVQPRILALRGTATSSPILQRMAGSGTAGLRVKARR